MYFSIYKQQRKAEVHHCNGFLNEHIVWSNNGRSMAGASQRSQQVITLFPSNLRGSKIIIKILKHFHQKNPEIKI